MADITPMPLKHRPAGPDRALAGHPGRANILVNRIAAADPPRATSPISAQEVCATRQGGRPGLLYNASGHYGRNGSALRWRARNRRCELGKSLVRAAHLLVALHMTDIRRPHGAAAG